jgi:transcriptional regulator with XRE-family HTH domain
MKCGNAHRSQPVTTSAKPEMTFAEQLKSQRQRLGLTQSEAADLLEVSASWMDKAEREIRTPIKITQEGAIARLSKAKAKKVT